jgi:hypothetical protein
MIQHPAFLIKARPLQGYMDFQCLPISVENRRGNVRQWYDPHEDREGATRMKVPYGYIRGTLGTDGDQVDVFVGPHRDATHAFIITQMKGPEFTEVDEQKVMLGFRTAEDAKRLYRDHYDDPRFFGSMQKMSMDEFKAKVMKTSDNGGELVKAVDEMAVLSRLLTTSKLKQYARKRYRQIGDDLGIDWDEVDFDQFAMGMKVELEHADITGGDLVLTAKIALAHLKELPDYYSRLEKMEKALSGAYLLRRA